MSNAAFSFNLRTSDRIGASLELSVRYNLLHLSRASRHTSNASTKQDPQVAEALSEGWTGPGELYNSRRNQIYTGPGIAASPMRTPQWKKTSTIQCSNRLNQDDT